MDFIYANNLAMFPPYERIISKTFFYARSGVYETLNYFAQNPCQLSINY